MRNLHVAIVILVVLALVFAFLSDWLVQGAPYKDDIINEAGKTIGALVVVAIVFERSLAVFNSLIFGDELTKARSSVLFHAEQGVSRAEWDRYQKALKEYEQLRLSLALLLGVLVSAAGVRTLEGILETDPKCSQFFYLVDIILTASLLAGGSNALARMVEVIKSRLEVTRLRWMGDVRRLPPSSDNPTV